MGSCELRLLLLLRLLWDLCGILDSPFTGGSFEDSTPSYASRFDRSLKRDDEAMDALGALRSQLFEHVFRA
jgi:hypothetical protein